MIGVPEDAEPAMTWTWSRGLTATPTGPAWQTCSVTWSAWVQTHGTTMGL